ncbi:hypothetical protein Pmani_008788 [Petrolisthes manimaculis]|uniref:Uncharacterized protein n=1 Tax=Petrolisthes manimaculis TaxID=1843537 RepID=A0AAE1Q5T1_9EUCA|nr:hypothetical protein Pmani_008788 [Petrolisthes manimaculis]
MLASLDSARQELTHALATGAAMPLGRNYLRRLADCVHELAGLTFQTFVEAGIAARTAARATPELAQRGVVKAGPLSPALCDQQAAQNRRGDYIPTSTLPTSDLHNYNNNKSAPPVQVKKSSALASLSGGIGLGIYSDSESEGDATGGEDEDERGDIDSDEELRQTIKRKRRDFQATERDILLKLQAEEMAERSGMKANESESDSEEENKQQVEECGQEDGKEMSGRPRQEISEEESSRPPSTLGNLKAMKFVPPQDPEVDSTQPDSNTPNDSIKGENDSKDSLVSLDSEEDSKSSQSDRSRERHRSRSRGRKSRDKKRHRDRSNESRSGRQHGSRSRGRDKRRSTYREESEESRSGRSSRRRSVSAVVRPPPAPAWYSPTCKFSSFVLL